jgi:septal ring factor EnvC (AmiA/AmiB activator)
MMPEWFNKDTVAIACFVFSAIVGPLLVFYLGRYFAKREAVDAVVKAFQDYQKQHASEHEEIDDRLDHGENRFTTLEASIREVKTAAGEARRAAENAQAAAEKVNGALIEIERVRGDLKEMRALVGPLKSIVAAAMVKIGDGQ